MAEDSVVIGDLVSADIRRGATGRYIRSHDLDSGPKLEAWLDTSLAQFDAHPLTRSFRNDLALCRTEFPPSGQLAFRVQAVCLADEGRPDAMRLAAPPPARASCGRYNEARAPALYLSECECGAVSELRCRAADQVLFWAMRYCIPPCGPIADIRPHAAGADWIAAVFDLCETVERDADRTYPRSRRLAALVRGAGFDGLMVPGVRGDPARIANHWNLVVFDPEECGVRWQVGDPYCLGCISAIPAHAVAR